MGPPTLRPRTIKNAFIVSCSLIVFGLITFAVGHFGGQTTADEKQQLDDLKNSWDSECTLSSLPGTPKVGTTTYRFRQDKCVKDKCTNVNVDAFIVECKAVLQMADV